MNKIVVIVPIYKANLSKYDRISLDRTCEVLASHDIVVVHPEGLDTTMISNDYPILKYKPFPK